MRVLCKGLCGLLFLLAAPALHAQGNNVIEGYVRTPDHRPFPGVTVVLKNSSGMQVDRTMTSEEGHYIFFQLGGGTFTVNVEPKPPYVGDSHRVEFVSSNENGHRREDFTLDVLAGRLRTPVSGEPLFAQQVPPEAEQAYQQAMKQLSAGQRENGIGHLYRAVKIFPDYYLALNQLTLEFLQQGNVSKTQQWSQRTVAVNPNSASGHFGLGWAYYQQEKLDEAAKELRQASTLNSRIADIHWFFALTALELGKWAEAEPAFQTFLELRPRDARPEVHLYLASVYDHMRRYQAAVDSLETYLKSIPAEERTQKLRDLREQLKRKSRPPH